MSPSPYLPFNTAGGLKLWEQNVVRHAFQMAWSSLVTGLWYRSSIKHMTWWFWRLKYKRSCRCSLCSQLYIGSSCAVGKWWRQHGAMLTSHDVNYSDWNVIGIPRVTIEWANSLRGEQYQPASRDVRHSRIKNNHGYDWGTFKNATNVNSTVYFST